MMAAHLTRARDYLRAHAPKTAVGIVNVCATFSATAWLANDKAVKRIITWNNSMAGLLAITQAILLKPNRTLTSEANGHNTYIAIFAAMYAHGCLVNFIVNVGCNNLKDASLSEVGMSSVGAFLLQYILATHAKKNDEFTTKYATTMLAYTTLSLIFVWTFSYNKPFGAALELTSTLMCLYRLDKDQLSKCRLLGIMIASILHKVSSLQSYESRDSLGATTTSVFIICSLLGTMLGQKLEAYAQIDAQATQRENNGHPGTADQRMLTVLNAQSSDVVTDGSQPTAGTN